MQPTSGYPIVLSTGRPVSVSRFWAIPIVGILVKAIILIPHFIVLCFVLIGWCVTTVVAWFVIVLTGDYPQGLWAFGVGALRWLLRVQAYMLLLVDEYPPYSLD